MTPFNVVHARMQYLLNNFQNTYNTLRPDWFLDLKNSSLFTNKICGQTKNYATK